MSDPAASLEHAEQLLQKRRLIEARAAFYRAEKDGVSPDRCAAGRWMISMLEGDFEAAWQESDAIRLRGAPDTSRFWNGEDIRGATVIVRSLHGFGDAVQMLRYAPMLREKAAKVIFEVPPRFVELAQCFLGVDDVTTWRDGAPAESPAWNIQVEVTELPYLFRTTTRDLPLAVNYLQMPSDAVQRAARAMMRAHTFRRRRVGLVWTAGEWNQQRSIPFCLVRLILGDDVAEFWSLQGGLAAQDAAGAEIRDATAECGDGLLSLAATIANLDLVITVDTLAAHVAGAMGKPVWVLLQHAADWRWMTERSGSPWYPTARLFRQRRSCDWTNVLEEVQNALPKFMTGTLEE